MPVHEFQESGPRADSTQYLAIRHRAWPWTCARLFLSALLCVVAAEATARGFWRLCCGVPLLRPAQILYAYYPELGASGELPEAPPARAQTRPVRGDEFYDVLLLGGSVLHKSWGSVETELREQLAALGHRDVRIFNLAMPAHTSRDSLLKYAALKDERFDLVIFYHGINEARVNNAPPDVFREDYGHYSWYALVNTLAPYHGSAYFALPYTLRYLAIAARSYLTKNRFVSTYEVRKEWTRYGKDPRSAAAFSRNVSALLELASQRGERLVLMTFALYIPENYSRKAFTEKQLDYRLHRAPIEWWGLPEHVMNAVSAHNQILRGVPARHEQVLLVDQASLMPGSALYFNDPCHLTAAGAARFVENVLAVLAPGLTERSTKRIDPVER